MTDRRRNSEIYARLISLPEFKSWINYEDEHLLVLNKPAGVVCHPSKAGVWSSLSGAAREYTGLDTAYLLCRLDRETSGIVLFAKNLDMVRRLTKAIGRRLVDKTYLAIMTGEFLNPLTVTQPLGADDASPLAAKNCVRSDGKAAITHFAPLSSGGGFTLARVTTETGRKHQIRAHAQWLGNNLVGDKMYGQDPACFLEFLETGWTPALASRLFLNRQALHCAVLDLRRAGIDMAFSAALPADMSSFCAEHGMSLQIS